MTPEDAVPIGTGIGLASKMIRGTDRFNEMFKVLVPDPAPNVSAVNYSVSAGTTLNLSFAVPSNANLPVLYSP